MAAPNTAKGSNATWSTMKTKNEKKRMVGQQEVRKVEDNLNYGDKARLKATKHGPDRLGHHSRRGS